MYASHPCLVAASLVTVAIAVTARARHLQCSLGRSHADIYPVPHQDNETNRDSECSQLEKSFAESPRRISTDIRDGPRRCA